MTGSALFAGDISLDMTMRVGHIPERDQKLHVDALSEAPGGVIANAAVAALRAGTPVRALLRFGDDLASREALSVLSGQGLDVEASTDHGALCRVVIIIDESGEKRLFLHPGISMYPTMYQARHVSLANIAWMHTAIYDPPVAAILIARCREAGIPFSIDLEPATFVDGIEGIAGHIDGAAVVFCNMRAATTLSCDAAQRLEKLGAKSVVLTLGSAGAIWQSRGQSFSIAAPMISVVDTTGAGDCLAGWFISETLRSVGPSLALHTAVVAASWSCAHEGAQASFPRRADITTMLKPVEFGSI